VETGVGRRAAQWTGIEGEGVQSMWRCCISRDCFHLVFMCAELSDVVFFSLSYVCVAYSAGFNLVMRCGITGRISFCF
jgi:hypothetical protein